MIDSASQATEAVLPAAPARVHFIGIGGVSMSGLARVLRDRGYVVTGSDSSESVTVGTLRNEGIPIVRGHTDSTLAACADVIVSTPRAAAQAGIELAAARARGALHVQRGQLLGMIANPTRLIAVAGTHGKSTTSGMIATALVRLGREPGYSVGASLPGLAHSTAAGSGDLMVVEADEFDRAFLWLRPKVSVITSVSFDHPDIYSSQDDYDAAFAGFARNTRQSGTIVTAEDDPGCRRLVQYLAASGTSRHDILTFGEGPGADWRLLAHDGGHTFTASSGERFAVNLSATGRHNARNALAAVAALVAIGTEASEAIAAVEPFTGVGRRFEHKGVIRSIDIVDDYAHHPEEIAAVLDAARSRYTGRRIIAVHQPHTYSRTRVLLEGFVASLNLADQVVLLDIYPSGETDPLGVSSHHILERLTVPAIAASGPEDAAAKVATLAKGGDIVLTLGAGDITRTGEILIDLLSRSPDPKDTPQAARPRDRAVTGSAVVTIPDAPGLKVSRDVSMSLYTTMRVGGTADFFVRAPTPDDVVAAARWAGGLGLPVTMIGGGSNLLVGDSGIRGVVIAARTPGVRAEQLVHVEDQGDVVRLTVGAQAPLSWVGRYCAEQGWAGMDWGVGLPGQIGGATVNNAGAHGTELKDHLVEIELLLDTGDIVREPARWLEATYRMTRIKGARRPRPWIVLRSVFNLPRADPATLIALADEHAEFRERTQPSGPCSGSTFANPEGDYAGRLLEAAGLKGFTLGAMQLSPLHANWVLNTGGGTAADAWELIQFARQTVLDQFGIALHPEIERVGEP